MFLFSPSVTPAVRSHLNAQAAFLNDMNKSLSRAYQELCQLNIQLGQTLLEESTIAGHQLLATDRPNEAFSIAASRAQPASEKLRAYGQHLARMAADAQVDISRVAEQHIQETAKTARTLADEVARVAAEETDRSLRHQEETLKNFRDPFQQGAWRGEMAAHGTMQHAGNGSGGADAASFQGNVQSAGQQAGVKAAKAG
ncbi:phasin family protein [Pseudoduganella flava]|uniref:Phasin family protein n=1 Tax=Pseudoduganella flava TaxID=871742 RepID=A0A562Q133_9BURK|nr:phasin family protein [Pseudoduganella flava]QGZ38118.1 TIGR01841 family phasin [Pseudoduganella flava]TWI50367.1 phasin family protein [Pseudoduganella flava]